MTQSRRNFYVLTGGSGSGKSTIIAALRARGFACAAEAGRQIVQEQLRRGGDGTPWQDRLKFRELLLARSIEIFEQVIERHRPVFFDRGIPEIIGYARFLEVPVPAHHAAAARSYRYAATVFVTPPWREIYENDAARRQPWADAVADYRVNVEAYTALGYRLVEVPKATGAERVDTILKHVTATAA